MRGYLLLLFLSCYDYYDILILLLLNFISFTYLFVYAVYARKDEKSLDSPSAFYK